MGMKGLILLLVLVLVFPAMAKKILLSEKPVKSALPAVSSAMEKFL